MEVRTLGRSTNVQQLRPKTYSTVPPSGATDPQEPITIWLWVQHLHGEQDKEEFQVS